MIQNKIINLTDSLHYDNEIIESVYKRQSSNKRIKVLWWISLILIIAIICTHSEIVKILKFIFINKNGDFQWIGITALITIISFLLTYLATLRKNRADLVSKARIEWLNFHRKEMADYLTASRDFYNKVRNEREFNTAKRKELFELMSELERRKNLLVLNLSDTDENRQFNDCIEDLAIWVNSFNKIIVNTDNTKYSYNDVPYVNLLKVSRDYYKNEWEKVKKGK